MVSVVLDTDSTNPSPVRTVQQSSDGYSAKEIQDWKILRNENGTIDTAQQRRCTEDIRLWRDSDLGDGMELLRAVCLSHRYPAHSHDEFVIACFEAGVQRHSIANKSGLAVPGSVMIIAPGDVHTGEAAEDVGMWAYRAFYPKPDVLENVAKGMFERSQISVNFGRESLREDRDVANRLIHAHRIIEGSRDLVEKQSALLEAFALLIRRYGQSSSGAAIRDLPVGDVRRALDLIHSCFHERLTIADIARSVGLSEFHFMRSFKQKTGMTVHAYITQTRLRVAKDHLAAGMSPAETAVTVGFFDQSHLTNRFRTNFGVTPKRFLSACC